jgi:hypothetical protein
VSRGSDLSSGINVGLRNERIERDGQQHHAQQKCAARSSGEATCLCSLFPRQQLGNQRLNAVNGSRVIAHSGTEQNSLSGRPCKVQFARPLSWTSATGRLERVLQAFKTGLSRWHARCNVLTVG